MTHWSWKLSSNRNITYRVAGGSIVVETEEDVVILAVVADELKEEAEELIVLLVLELPPLVVVCLDAFVILIEAELLEFIEDESKDEEEVAKLEVWEAKVEDCKVEKVELFDA